MLHTVNVRVTHQKADVLVLEAVSFPDVKKALAEIVALPSIKEAVIVQTCNRMEIFAAAEDVDVAHHDLLDYIMEHTISKMKKHAPPEVPAEKLVEHVIHRSKQFHDVIEVDYHTAALLHLLRLTSGLESMIVGEDQILGQVRDAYNLAKESGAVNQFFSTIFQKAIHVGQRVRSETEINKGAVSIGSAAVELAENVLGSLQGKKVLLVGAGEMGALVARSLSEHNLETILVANRTHERAVTLAKELGGRVIKFEEIENGMRECDVMITATGAPHAVIKEEAIKRAMARRKKKELVIIDVAIPRDVEETVGKLPNVKLFNIDGLRSIAEENKKQREKEAVKVEGIIEEEISLLVKQIYKIDVSDIVKAIFESAEEVRRAELEKAIKMLGNGISEKEKHVLNDLTSVIVKRTMTPIADRIRKAAETGDKDAIAAAEKLLLKEKSKKAR